MLRQRTKIRLSSISMPTCYMAMHHAWLMTTLTGSPHPSSGCNLRTCLGKLGEVRGIVLDQVLHLLATQGLAGKDEGQHRPGPNASQELIRWCAPDREGARCWHFGVDEDALDDGMLVQRREHPVLRLVIHIFALVNWGAPFLSRGLRRSLVPPAQVIS